MEEKQSEAVFAKDWAHMHSVCFSSVDDDLRNMINYLDKEITEVVRLRYQRVHIDTG